MITGDLLALRPEHLAISSLGEPSHPSPMAGLLGERRPSIHWVDESDRVLFDDTQAMAAARGVPVDQLPAFEPSGPRKILYFDPPTTRAGVVTCGGLCPGLNNVIRALVLELLDRYGIEQVVGFRGGYRGLTPEGMKGRLTLTADAVRDIQNDGGTILGTSRGSQDPDTMLDTLVELGVSVLFVVGGDGSLRGAQAIADAAAAREVELAVVGIPKTIDNDIPFLDRSFGFQTAFARAAESIRAARTEAISTANGVGLVKLMGRHSGFIACYAALAHHAVDFVLIPEVPFRLEGPGGLGYDAVYCLRLAQAAVHAAMAGRTGMVVGQWHGRFVHIPIALATRSRNQVDPHGDLWMSVLEATGQTARFE